MKRTVLFRKKLTHTDVKFRMVFPMKSYREVLQIQNGDLSQGIDVIDVEDKSVKNFICTKRHKGHHKPVFSKGWISFVKEKHLVAGDKVIFCKEEDKVGRIRFKIHAKKVPCLLFGFDLREAIRKATYPGQQN
ncbi:hypothetical protein MANES_07G021700v8 [Manihot esculenta]|uniref:Uncharacterized protein n=1 Tax=Manihot esculenta TaxID=3983 RepID=A0ACB7HDN6_MANES|nr:hypothetical protein MANES_07G021700v8 [Manihot esculenta]